MLNNRLRELRLERQMTMKEVGEKVGRSVSSISRLENNLVKKLDIDLIERLADVLNTSPEYLRGMSDNRDYISDTGIAKYFTDDSLKTLLVTNDEMAPEIPEDAYVKIRELKPDETLAAGSFYYVEFDNKKYIRMAVTDSVNDVHLMPHNRTEQRIAYDREYVKIIGKIVAIINIMEDN